MSAFRPNVTEPVSDVHSPTPADWRECLAVQQASYASETRQRRVLAALAGADAPLASEGVSTLARGLARVARGEAFILQMGDCAEAIADANADAVERKVALLDAAALAVTEGRAVDALKIGRIAGQYGKPRSQPVETQNDLTLPAFRGESINGYEFSAESRAANPLRLRSAYLAAKRTHELLLASNRKRGLGAEREHVFTSHEALHLVFEDALSRDDAALGRYNALGHLVWVGARTNHPDHAHVRYCAGLANPVAVKVSPKTTPEDVRRLYWRLNPRAEAGRLTFISRMGANSVRPHLPALVRALDDIGAIVLWMCDPMHGNTFAAPSGIKTRSLADIRSDVGDTIDVLARSGHRLAGVHLETSPDDVLECVSSRESEDELAGLGARFLSKCDPRLNRTQTLELCRWLAHRLGATALRS